MTYDETKQLMKALDDFKADMTKRMDELDAKIDKAVEFQNGFQGAARTLMYIVLVLAAAVTIYVGLRGGILHGGAK